VGTTDQIGYSVLVTLRRSKWPVLLAAWTIVILMVGVLPVSNFVGHSHWEYIRWVPTTDQLRSPFVVLDLTVDALANILLFAPFGFSFACRKKLTTPIAVITLALLLSSSIELYQVYCHNRNTSLLDILDNVFGAYLGFRLATRFFERSIPVESSRIAPIPSP
jgi:glycopeptide antibiotics resistance protein